MDMSAGSNLLQMLQKQDGPESASESAKRKVMRNFCFKAFNFDEIDRIIEEEDEP